MYLHLFEMEYSQHPFTIKPQTLIPILTTVHLTTIVPKIVSQFHREGGSKLGQLHTPIPHPPTPYPLGHPQEIRNSYPKN